MKLTIGIKFIPILFFFYGCTHNDDTISINDKPYKLNTIEYITDGHTVKESFYYNEDGLLLAIENFRGFSGSLLLAYSGKTFTSFGCMQISYNASRQVTKIQCIAYDKLLVVTQEFNYKDDGKVINIKFYFSDEFKAEASEETLLNLREWEDTYYWEGNNIKRALRNLNGKFHSEVTYSYDNSINFYTAVPVPLKRGEELSENNVIFTETVYAEEVGELPVYSNPHLLEYDEKGRVIKITETTEGPDGSNTKIKQITYKN